MDIRTIEFEGTLVLIHNNQKIRITPFKTEDSSIIKFGIDAPYGVSVNREEIYKNKKARAEIAVSRNKPGDYPKIVQNMFSELISINHKSEKLQKTAKQLFSRDKIITAKTIACIASGEKSTTAWIVTCVINMLMIEKPESLKHLLSSDDMLRLWLKPLLKQGIDKTTLLETAKKFGCPSLLEHMTN